MNWIYGRNLIAALCGMLALFCLETCASALRNHKEHPYRYSDVDMPVSLAVGTVRTPEFSVKDQAYFIMLQAQKGHLPFVDMQCMMGLASSPFEKENCHQEPLLQTTWKVWDGKHLVAAGANRTEADDEYTDRYLFKFLGKFLGESGKKYVVEVTFTKDGTPLNVADPHLIVISVRNH
jgi:hypothetical protein